MRRKIARLRMAEHLAVPMADHQMLIVCHRPMCCVMPSRHRKRPEGIEFIIGCAHPIVVGRLIRRHLLHDRLMEFAIVPLNLPSFQTFSRCAVNRPLKSPSEEN